ncbi:MAG: hypothetical protein KatS3mg027_2061 [Bacteroidia bacterium]|nr:MAG: hypothetical protein KatS3mg027_2061 [Bacteroidia bacterium]
MKVAVVGATGLVGQEMIKVLEEFSISCNRIYSSSIRKIYWQKS